MKVNSINYANNTSFKSEQKKEITKEGIDSLGLPFKVFSDGTKEHYYKNGQVRLQVYPNGMQMCYFKDGAMAWYCPPENK